MKPVKYVVDSHYHYDHAFGNQVFAPDAQVIGHENTRKRMLGALFRGESITLPSAIWKNPGR